MFKTTLTAGVLGLSLSAFAAQAAVINGDFETGELGPWFQDRSFSDPSDAWSITAVDSNTGEFSATGTGNNELRQDFVAIDADSILNLSFSIRHEVADVATAFIFFYDDGSSDQNVVRTAGTGWETFEVSDLLDTSLSLVGFSLFGNSGGCPETCRRTFVDDVVIDTAAVPLPASGLLLLGATAFMARRKKRS